MTITCSELGKKYNQHWVFRNFSHVFSLGDAVAITGNNGSGKSTLLKVLAGFERSSAGKLRHESGGTFLDDSSLYRAVSLCTPYQSLYEDLSAEEHYQLHARFKKMFTASFEEFSHLLELPNTGNKALRHYSSGMRQRVKLALAILSDVPLLFLDEPLTNLDSSSAAWYKKMVSTCLGKKIIFVASNLNEGEIFFCQERIGLENLK